MGKVTLILSIILIVFGVVAVVAGLIQYFVIKDKVKNTVIEGLVVSSTESEGYESFIRDDPEEPSGILYKCHFWNLTNSEATLNGTTPNFQNVGPYTYRRRGIKVNVEFSDDGNKVSYQEYGNYTYEASLSAANANPETDQIISVNPAYWKIVSSAGGKESNFYLSGIPQAFQNIRLALNGTGAESFPPFIAVASGGGVFSQTLQTIISAIMQEEGVLLDEAEDIFWTHFLNETSSSLQSIPPYMLLFAGKSSPLLSEEDIFDIMQVLVDPGTLFSLASSDASTIGAFHSLSLGMDYSQFQGPMESSLGFNPVVVEAYATWRSTTFNTVVKGALVTHHSLTVFEDIGYLHWGSPNGVLNGSSFYDFPTGLAGIPEFGIYAKRHNLTDVSMTLANIKDFFDNMNLQNLMLLSAGSGPLFTILGLANVMQFSQYVQQNIVPNFVKPEVEAMFRGKIFLRATPEEQIFGRFDPFVESLSPGAGNVPGIFTDFTLESALDSEPDTFRTGKDDYLEAGRRLTFNGNETLHIYTPPQPVEGYNNLAWVGPGRLNVDDPEKLPLFVTQVARHLYLIFDDDSEVKGIPTKKYVADPESPSLVQSSVWNNPTNLLLDLERHYGIPLFFSLPAFNRVDPKLTTDLITGVVPNQEEHNIFFHFEPITGLAINVHAPLQASLHMSPATFDGPHSTIANNRYYPLYYLVRAAQISDDDAVELKKQGPKLAQSILTALIVLVVLGGLAILAGIILLIVYLFRRGSSGGSDVSEIEMGN